MAKELVIDDAWAEDAEEAASGPIIEWSWNYVIVCIMMPALNGIVAGLPWSGFSLYYRTMAWPIWRSGLATSIGFLCRVLTQQLQLRWGLWVAAPMSLLHVAFVILGMCFSHEEWAVALQVGALLAFDPTCALEGIAFEQYCESEEMASAATSTLLTVHTVAVSLSVTMGGVFYDLESWYGVSVCHLACQGPLCLLLLLHPSCHASFREVFLGHIRQPVDVDLAADNAVFDKVVPEAKGPDVKDADVKADGEWKLQDLDEGASVGSKHSDKSAKATPSVREDSPSRVLRPSVASRASRLSPPAPVSELPLHHRLSVRLSIRDGPTNIGHRQSIRSFRSSASNTTPQTVQTARTGATAQTAVTRLSHLTHRTGQTNRTGLTNRTGQTNRTNRTAQSLAHLANGLQHHAASRALYPIMAGLHPVHVDVDAAIEGNDLGEVSGGHDQGVGEALEDVGLHTVRRRKLPRDMYLPTLLILLCCFSNSCSFVTEFSTFSIYFKEVHGLNNTTWASLAQTAGDLLAALWMQLTPLLFPVQDEDKVDEYGPLRKTWCYLMSKPYNLSCLLVMWAACNFLILSASLPVAMGAQIMMGTVYVYCSKVVGDLNIFYSLGDSGVFITLQVYARSADAVGATVSGIVSSYLYGSVAPESPFLFTAVLSLVILILFSCGFCSRIGFGDNIERAEQTRSRHLGLRRVSSWKSVRNEDSHEARSAPRSTVKNLQQASQEHPMEVVTEQSGDDSDAGGGS